MKLRYLTNIDVAPRERANKLVSSSTLFTRCCWWRLARFRSDEIRADQMRCCATQLDYSLKLLLFSQWTTPTDVLTHNSYTLISAHFNVQLEYLRSDQIFVYFMNTPISNLVIINANKWGNDSRILVNSAQNVRFSEWITPSLSLLI